MRAHCYLAGSAELAAVVDHEGLTIIEAEIQEVARMLANLDAQILTIDSDLLSGVVEAYLDAGQIADLDIALRGAGMTGAPRPLSVRRTGWAAHWLDVSSQYPDSDPIATADGLGAGRPDGSALGSAQWLQRLHSEWIAIATAAIGTDLSITLAATAAKIGIPAQWRLAHRAATAAARKPRLDGYDLSGWIVAQRSFYGGRVACLASQEWRGDAVEYDLRSAYGWAMTQRLPDWKTYDRKPWPSQPAWYDVTVQLEGALGQLPVRETEGAPVLSYPSGGAVRRGIWTREDLDRATGSGAKVLEQHGAMSGRWSHDLQPPVAHWLEQREKATIAPVRALFRFMCNSLAGKLVQKSQGWRLWDARDGHPPKRSVLLSIGGWAWAYPVTSAFQPVTCPQAGSYITATVRSAVWPELSRPDALYSDTDSIHLPASAAPPANTGTNPGQWAEKVRGPAQYFGPKHYKIGSKYARAPRVWQG